MLDSFKPFTWFLKVHHYDTPAQLLADLDERVLRTVEAEVARLRA